MKEQHAFGGSRKQPRPQQQKRVQEPQLISFGNYELFRRIDVGGMGEVYLAHQKSAFGREVAVKIIRSDLMYDAVARQRFKREAEVNAHLKHEHILSLVEFGEEKGRLFIVTPYIAGGTLAQRLQRGPMSLDEVHQLFSALVRAVAYIHKRGVIHRDLKPSNILLDQEDGQLYVRLIDFGIASIQGSADHPAPNLTQAGHEMATIEYMAPERLDGIVGPSNDIYSLGIILYEMLMGVLPGAQHDLAPLAAPMRYVVEHCTYRDPDKRFHSADELLNVFEQAYHAVLERQRQPDPAPAISPSTSIEPPSQQTQLDHGDEMPRRVARPHSIAPSLPSVPVPALHPVAAASPVVPSVIPAALSSPVSGQQTFTGSDYDARTTYIDPSHLATGTPRETSTITQPPRTGRRRSFFVAISLVMLAIILLIGTLGYVAFTNSITATINISPQVHTLTSVLTVQAKPGQHAVDPINLTVPAYILNDTKTGSQTGKTTGVQCTLFVINCQSAVAASDVDTLSNSITQTLKPEIQQDLQTQVQTGGYTTVGTVQYTVGAPTSNPTVGTVGKTVTVTQTEQGGIEAIKSQDVKMLAQNRLTQKAQQQYGSGYTLLSSYSRIGNPVIQSVDANGVVTIKIAVGGVVEYNISPSIMQQYQSTIRGKQQSAATNYLKQQQGLDTTSVLVHVTYGDTLPVNVNQIHIIVVNPANIPEVQLPTI